MVNPLRLFYCEYQIPDFIIFIEYLFDSDFQTEVPVSHTPTTPSAPNSPPPRIKKPNQRTKLVTLRKLQRSRTSMLLPWRLCGISLVLSLIQLLVLWLCVVLMLLLHLRRWRGVDLVIPLLVAIATGVHRLHRGLLLILGHWRLGRRHAGLIWWLAMGGRGSSGGCGGGLLAAGEEEEDGDGTDDDHRESTNDTAADGTNVGSSWCWRADL